MMTAMNLSHLPPALIRSGRVELWLEMKLPDAAARGRILERQTKNLPVALQTAEQDKLIKASETFTGADIKRLVEDAKGLYAFDRIRNSPARPATEYFMDAAVAVRENKQRYQQAEMAARARPKNVNPLAALMASRVMQKQQDD
jgi:ATP-dependent 26S proteasome regulatory subunit